MPFGDLFPLELLPVIAVPSRKRTLVLIGLVWCEVPRSECEYSTIASRILPYRRDPRRTDSYVHGRRTWLA
jgi:hypothetical protein